MKIKFLILAGVLFIPAMVFSQDDAGKTIYLTTVDSAPLQLKILKETPLNLTQASNTYMTFLPRGQIVDVLAIAKYQLQVRGRMRTGAVQGWVNRGDVEPISDEVLKGLQEKIKSQKEMDAAIKRKEVIFGMTQDQVRAILGKPADKTSIRDEDGVSEVWTYYSYRSVPVMQTYGFGTNAYTQVVTQKIRTGSKTISFQDGKVMRIEQKSEQNLGQETVGYPVGMPVVIPKSGAY